MSLLQKLSGQHCWRADGVFLTLLKIMNAVVHAFFTLVIFDLHYFHPSLTKLQLTMDFMCSNCGYALIPIFFIWASGWFKQTIVRTKFKSKHQPGSKQTQTLSMHQPCWLPNYEDEIFHHPDNKEIMHSNVLEGEGQLHKGRRHKHLFCSSNCASK